MIIAIDIGGTLIKIGLVTGAGEIFAREVITAHADKGLIFSLIGIESAIERLLTNSAISVNEISGIGIGFPGIVDSNRMRVLSTNKKYDDAVGFDFKKWSIEKYKTPIFIENDARVALLGEWKYGAGSKSENIVMVTYGTGVGTAAVIEGQLLKGKHFQAGCLGGHFTVHVNGSECTCGNLGCVEAEASTWKLESMLKSDSRYANSVLYGKKPDFENVFNYAEEGDELCVATRDYCLDVWAAGIISLVHAYDPEIVILGGGIMQSSHVIIPFMRERVGKYSWTPWGSVEIVRAEIPDKSALLGAYYMVKRGIA